MNQQKQIATTTPEPEVNYPALWDRLFAAVHELGTAEDRDLLDSFWLKFVILNEARGKNSWGEVLPAEMIRRFREDYLRDVDAIRHSAALTLLPAGIKREVEATVSAFPTDAGVDTLDSFILPKSISGIGNRGSCAGRSLTPAELIAEISDTEKPTSNLRTLLEKRGFVRWTKEALRDHLLTLPGAQRRLAIVYVEDVYETTCGDGYYLYPNRAYFSIRAAGACAVWVTRESRKRPPSCGFNAEAHWVEIVADQNGGFRVPHPRGVERVDWEEMELIELLNGDCVDWTSTVRACVGPRGVEPDFEAEAECDAQ